MISLSCDVLKNNCRSGVTDFNCLKFVVLENGNPFSGVRLRFSSHGHASLSAQEGVTNKNGECFVIVRNKYSEDISIKAMIVGEEFDDYQYGILSFLDK